MKRQLAVHTGIILLIFAFLTHAEARPRLRPRPFAPDRTANHEMLGLILGNNLDTETYFIGAHFQIPAGHF